MHFSGIARIHCERIVSQSIPRVHIMGSRSSARPVSEDCPVWFMTMRGFLLPNLIINLRYIQVIKNILKLIQFIVIMNTVRLRER